MPPEPAAPSIRRRLDSLTTPGGLFGAVTMCAMVVPVTAPVSDPDFWWHLRAGQLIADRGGLLGTDPFTYTAAGHRWVMHEWLSELSFAGLHRLGGLGVVALVLTAVTVAGLAAIVARVRLPLPDWPPRPGGPDGSTRRVGPVPLGLGMILASIAGYPIWGPRAQMITFAFTCLTLWLAERHLRVGGRAAWLLVPAFLVWCNFHSGFVIGAAFLVAILAAEGAAQLLRLGGRAPMERVRGLAVIVAACAVIVVLNPNGPGIYLYPFATQGSAAQQSLIQEWHSPDFHDGVVRAFEVMLLSLAAMVVVTRRMRLRDAVLVLATTAMALQSVRHIALFVAAATPVWIEQADAVAGLVRARRVSARALRTSERTSGAARPARTGSAARTSRRTRSGPRPARPGQASRPPLSIRVTMLTLVVLGPLAAEGVKLATAVTTREDSLYYAKTFPVCGARWLEAAPGGLRILNQYGEGGYLALRLSAHGDRVYIFGDAALMGDDLLTSYGSVESVRPVWSSVLVDSGTQVVLFDKDTPLTDVMAKDPRWTEVYRDDLSVAFVPDTASGRATLASLPDAAATRGSDGVCAGATTVARR